MAVKLFSIQKVSNWSNIGGRYMNVLITGGAGYIGSHCNKFLHQKNINTIIVDNLSFGHSEAVKWGAFIEGDFGDKCFINSIFKDYNIDAVMHFAAYANVSESVIQPNKYYINNVSNMINLLDSMVENNVKYIVFSSSAATFGNPKYTPIDENHSQDPINPYGETKLIGEKLLRDYEKAYGIKYAIMRYFNAAGADLDCEIGESHYPEHHLLPVIFQVCQGVKDKLNIYGNNYPTKDGSCIRDFIHVTDLAWAHYLALEYLISENQSQDFNLGSNIGFSVKEIVKKCEEILDIQINYQLSSPRLGDPATLIASNSKIKSLLNWEPKYSDLETIIKSAWAWEKIKDY